MVKDKNKIKKELIKWFNGLIKSFKKSKGDMVQKIFRIFLIPFIIYYLAIALLDFGWFTTIGFIFACFKGLSRAIEDPNKILVWSVGFVGGAALTPTIFNIFWPQIQEGTALSIFSGFFILFILIPIWWKFHKLKSE